MDFIDKIGILGIGQAGNNGAIAAKEVGFTKVALMNTSDKDMNASSTTLPQFILKNNELKDDDGVAQDREEAKERLKKNAKAVIDFLKEHFSDTKLLLIVSSTTGGSGSGLAPIINDLVNRFMNNDVEDVHPVLFPFVGAYDEGKQSALNTKAYLQEAYSSDATVLHVNNGIMGGNTKRLLELNNVVMEDLFNFFKENQGSVHGNLDNKEKIKTFKPSGGIVFSKITKENNFSKATEKMIEKLNNGFLLKPEFNETVAISSVLVQTKNEKILDENFSVIKNIQNLMGIPVHNFKGSHIGKENSIMVVYSGLTYPLSYLEKLNTAIENYMKNHKEREEDLDSFFEANSSAKKVFSINKSKKVKKKSENLLDGFDWENLDV